MGEVGGAVQRIHVPAELPFQPVPRTLFAIDAMFGEDLAESLADQLLGSTIGHGDQIHIALIFGFDTLNEELFQLCPCFARNGRSLRNPIQSLYRFNITQSNTPVVLIFPRLLWPKPQGAPRACAQPQRWY